MKILSRVACATVLALLITVAAHADPLQPMRVTPDELEWEAHAGGEPASNACR